MCTYEWPKFSLNKGITNFDLFLQWYHVVEIVIEDKDETTNPLVLFEKSLQTNGKEIDDDELLYMRRQVKFCSQWCLDNLCK